MKVVTIVPIRVIVIVAVIHLCADIGPVLVTMTHLTGEDTGLGQLGDMTTVTGYVSGTVRPALFAVPSLPIATRPHRSCSQASTHADGVREEVCGLRSDSDQCSMANIDLSSQAPAGVLWDHRTQTVGVADSAPPGRGTCCVGSEPCFIHVLSTCSVSTWPH